MSAYEEIGLRNVNGRATGHHSGLDFAGAFAFLAETEVLLILVSVLCIDVRSVSVACFVSECHAIGFIYCAVIDAHNRLNAANGKDLKNAN